MKHILKRWTALFMSLVMAITSMPVHAYALTTEDSNLQPTENIIYTYDESDDYDSLPGEAATNDEITPRPDATLSDTPQETDTSSADDISDETLLSSDFLSANTCGDNLSWEIDSEGALTVTGTGDMWDFEPDAEPWYNHRGSITNIIIESGVTSIGNNAFRQCVYLENIQIPKTVTHIGNGAFRECFNLVSVNIPSGITTIEPYLFYGCYSIKSIKIPQGVTSIGNSAFLQCSLEYIELPSTLQFVDEYAFNNRLDTVYFNGTEAQWERIQIANFNESLFSAQKIFKPESVASGNISNDFSWELDEKGMLSVNGTGDMPDLGNSAPWNEYVSNISAVRISDGVLSVSRNAFSGCINIKSISIPESVTSIGNRAFAGCSSLETIVINEGVTFIGENAFSNCSSLTQITLPESVTTIGAGAFSGLESLQKIVYNGTWQQIKKLTSDNANTSLPLEKVNCQNELNFTYELNSDNTATITGVINETSGIVSIPESIYGYTVTAIGSQIFGSLAEITGVIIPDTVKTIGEKAFYEIPFKYIEIGNSVETIGDSAFYYSASNIRDNTSIAISFTDSLRYIGNNAFNGQHIDSVHIPATVETIGVHAFGEVSHISYAGTVQDWIDICQIEQLSDYKINILTAADSSMAFAKYIDYDGQQTDEYALLYLNGNTENIIIPAEFRDLPVEHIENCVFVNKSAVKEIHIDTAIGTIPVNFFNGCVNLETVHLPYSLYEIGQNAFKECSSLKEIYFPSEFNWKNSIYINSGNSALQNAHLNFEHDWGYSITDFQSTDSDEIITGIIITGKMSTGQTLTIPSHLHGLPVLFIGGYTKAVFKDNTTIKEVFIPDTIQKIDRNNFKNCTKLEKITISGSTSLGDSAFAGCTNLKEINFTANKYGCDISSTVFEGVPKSVKITIDNSSDAYSSLKRLGFTNINQETELPSSYKLQYTLEGVPAIGLQPGESAEMHISTKETGVLSTEMFDFTSDNEALAIVDATGKITAVNENGVKGSVKITAKLRNDVKNRKVTATVTVIPRQTDTITITAEIDESVSEEYIRQIKIDYPYDDTTPVIIIPRHLVKGGTLPISLKAEAKDDKGNAIITNVKWSTDASNIAKVAAVKGTTDRALVTVGKNADGLAVITATSNDLKKVASTIEIDVRDYTPRLEASTVTLNTYKIKGEAVKLYTAYDAILQDYSEQTAMLLAQETQVRAVRLTGEGSENFTAEYNIDDSTVVFYTGAVVKNGTYKLNLEITTALGNTTQPVTIKVANKLPKVTVKQNESFEMFFKDSTADIIITAKDPADAKKAVEIKSVIMEDTVTFTAGEYDKNTGSITVRYADQTNPLNGYKNNKADTKVNLTVSFEGYRESHIQKNYTIKAKETKITLGQSRTSTKYTVLGNDNTPISITNSKSKEVIDLAGCTVTVQEKSADYVSCSKDSSGTELIITPKLNENNKFKVNGKEYASHSAKVDIQHSNWLRPVTISHSISINTAVPTVKLKTATLKLNSAFDTVAETVLVPSLDNCPVPEFTVTARPTKTQSEEIKKLDVTVEGWNVKAEFKDETDLPAKGTYKFTITGKIGETELKAVTVSVNVSGTLPSVSLTKTSVKLNRQIDEETVIPLKVPAGYEVTGAVITNAKGNNATQDDISVEYTSEGISVKIKNSDLKDTSYKYEIIPVVKLAGNEYSKETVLEKKLTLTVTVYGKTPVITAKASGKIDLVTRDKGITYTITSGTNFIYSADDVDTGSFMLTGSDKDKFIIEYDGRNAKGQHTVVVKAKTDESFTKGGKYYYNISVNINGIAMTLAKDIKVSPSQSTLKFNVKGSTTIYQSYHNSNSFNVSVASPAGAEIADVKILDTKATTVPSGALGYRVVKNDDGSWKVEYNILKASKLKVNKTYKLALEIIPVGNGENVKPVTLNVNLKVKR